ncbi:MAG: FKBP-type peptidyl-prolyl cis-trans isomerase [Crocinitomicaceae bacterium]|nr:FKBP-type peptidyl-prolyl cis-trans isomerase [Crocinitomicaceae bacterium]
MNKFFYIAIAILFVSCTEEKKPVEPEFEWDKIQSSELNSKFAKQEEIDIKLYLEMRPKWEMTKTGSGLRYWVYKSGEGEGLVSGDIAEVEYSVGLLDGTECYSTDSDEYVEVIIDHSEVETGMQEALKLLKVGDMAKVIVPSHLGHGLLGDLDKIPPQRTLVIDLTLLGITK